MYKVLDEDLDKVMSDDDLDDDPKEDLIYRVLLSVDTLVEFLVFLL